jgi:thioredoxin 1
MIAPILEVIAEERNDINILKINVDELPRIAGRFGITSIPTLMVFQNGKLLTTSLGYKAKPQIENLLK